MLARRRKQRQRPAPVVCRRRLALTAMLLRTCEVAGRVLAQLLCRLESEKCNRDSADGRAVSTLSGAVGSQRLTTPRHSIHPHSFPDSHLTPVPIHTYNFRLLVPCAFGSDLFSLSSAGHCAIIFLLCLPLPSPSIPIDVFIMML